MLQFEPFSEASLIKILPYIRKSRSLCSEFSAGYLYMWSKDTDVRFCLWNETLSISETIGEQIAFSYPIGADPNGMIDELKDYAHQNQLPLRFFAADDEILEKIRGDERLADAMWSYERRWSDYIYSAESALTFRGKKFSGQRNHINRFKKLYGEPDLRLLTKKDLPAVFSMLAEYEAEHPGANQLERMELESTKQLLGAYESLGLYAAGLFVEGKIAAFSIGEIAGNTLFIHVEKALRKYEGAYPTMYSGFVRLIHDTVERMPEYINREDDSGDEGLRTSKMQYHPTALIHKYLVHVASPAAKLKNLPTIPAGGVVLTPLRESDKAAYRALCTDLQNNRYWGYDYREDASITGEIDDDTFYNDVKFDTEVGDSINFAIRLCEDGELIGEAILWNMTSNASCELGCRILPAYQGKGYGKVAFSAAADFAETSLRLCVTARCDKRNTASRRMIERSGFALVRQDKTYFYFER